MGVPAQAELLRRAPIVEGKAARDRHGETPLGGKPRERPKHIVAQLGFEAVVNAERRRSVHGC